MTNKHTSLIVFATAMLLVSTFTAPAKVDLVTLPKQDSVQLTIYNSADLTLVRDSRQLTLSEGANSLQFSWANTLIDPTSLDLVPLKNADQVDIMELVYPPLAKDVGVWKVMSQLSGRTPMKITYFTSGLSWRAFYMGTLSDDEKTMRLQGYVMVSNHSGEDYEDAQTRLIVGKVNLLDQIAELAQRTYPYGRPVSMDVTFGGGMNGIAIPKSEKRMMLAQATDFVEMGSFAEEPKEIKKEGLSEYFLYTIPGTETIPDGWSKRLPSFEVDDVPVRNFYKYDERRYGTRPERFLSFRNDEEHKLGETPIPGGGLTVYRSVDKEEHLSYEGMSRFQYIPVGEDVELQLGSTKNVVVEVRKMKYRTYDYLFNNDRDISGWLEEQIYSIEVKNTRPVPIRIEIKRHFRSNYWTIKNTGDYGDYEKVDARSVKYTLEIPPRSSKTFGYTLTIQHGKHAER